MPRNRSEKNPFADLPKSFHQYAKVVGLYRAALESHVEGWLLNQFREERETVWANLSMGERGAWLMAPRELRDQLKNSYYNEFMSSELILQGRDAAQQK